MIKRVIKNDGTVQDFSPNKLNKWATWAAEGISQFVDWPMVARSAVSGMGEEVSTSDIQNRLIKVCLDQDTDAYNTMAGHLLGPLLQKETYPAGIPSIRELHAKLGKLGLMLSDLDYTEADYLHLESVIDHTLDYATKHSELTQVYKKYSIQDRATGAMYETQQFTYMRMAMALAEVEPITTRLTSVEGFYKELSGKRLNAPTPNYTNLGTRSSGYFSCCLYASEDTGPSLGAGEHIAHTMTLNNAGLGSITETRSVGDSVAGGAIVHQGKIPYYRALSSTAKANMQNGRSGAVTTYFTFYDPEILELLHLKNPMTPEDKRVTGIDYALIMNSFCARKIARDESVFLFNVRTAPDLYDAIYDADEQVFANLYAKYEADTDFVKVYHKARDIFVVFATQALESGRLYFFNATEVNRHTPHKDTIRQSNLCLEITQPTEAYERTEHLFSTDIDTKGEISLCALAAINVSEVDHRDKEAYSTTMMYALKMIDRCIDIAYYPFQHLKLTAQARRNAGVGILGLAHRLAKEGFTYTSEEGKRYMHELAEFHSYAAIEQSLLIAEQLGVPDWMHKTKWPEGWLPIDTYNKGIDKEVADSTLACDWESLRSRIVKNGGIRHSSLVAHMPCESSSKATGTTNGLYPIRDITLIKTDGTGKIDWTAPDSDSLTTKYQLAWDITTKDMFTTYGIFQKFADQAISADEYVVIVDDTKVSTTELIENMITMFKLGMKTRYYVNTRTTAGGFITDTVQESNCQDGVCSI